jgi:hypothetical protein
VAHHEQDPNPAPPDLSPPDSTGDAFERESTRMRVHRPEPTGCSSLPSTMVHDTGQPDANVDTDVVCQSNIWNLNIF